MIAILQGIRYSLHIIFHPFDGFYDMRHEKKGNAVSAVVLCALYTIITIMKKQLGGFLVNEYNPETYNIFREILGILIPVLLFCISNWCITALTDGEGRFVDIFMAVSYSLVPVSIATVVYIIVSNVIDQNELDFLGIIMSIGLVWTGFLIFSGILTIHQFTVTRTVFTIVITIIGIVFIVFLAMLFGSIIDGMYGYIAGIVTEIRLRM